MGVAEAGAVDISIEAARHIAHDFEVETDRAFWQLWRVAASTRISCLLDELEESRGRPARDQELKDGESEEE